MAERLGPRDLDIESEVGGTGRVQVQDQLEGEKGETVLFQAERCFQLHTSTEQLHTEVKNSSITFIAMQHEEIKRKIFFHYVRFFPPWVTQWKMKINSAAIQQYRVKGQGENASPTKLGEKCITLLNWSLQCNTSNKQ